MRRQTRVAAVCRRWMGCNLLPVAVWEDAIFLCIHMASFTMLLLSSWLLPALEATAFLAVKLLAFGLLHIHSGNRAELTAP